MTDKLTISTEYTNNIAILIRVLNENQRERNMAEQTIEETKQIKKLGEMGEYNSSSSPQKGVWVFSLRVVAWSGRLSLYTST